MTKRTTLSSLGDIALRMLCERLYGPPMRDIHDAADDAALLVAFLRDKKDMRTWHDKNKHNEEYMGPRRKQAREYSRAYRARKRAG